jgi:site-specific DNA-methyltransferase (adenine-specific)
MDCMEGMKQFPDKYFELAIVDPPYGISITDSGRLGKYNVNGNRWDDNIPTDDYFNELFRVSENQIIWGGNYFPLPPTRGFIIWDKKQPEGVSFASCEFAWSSFDRSAKTFYFSPMQDKYRFHPTQKACCSV